MQIMTPNKLCIPIFPGQFWHQVEFADVHRSLREVLSSWIYQEMLHTMQFLITALLLLPLLTSGKKLICDRGFNYPGKTWRHTFEISYISGAPDRVKVNHILGINGKFPGPTLEVVMYDRLEIRVINKIQDGQNVSIHWHGVQQRGTPFEDGPSQIMQCPIKYGSYQVYNFELDRPGTYWYHSHVLSQYTEGLWGVLIVHNTHEVYCERYDEEFTITLTDWYHKSAHENEAWHLSRDSKGAPPYPDSVLMNGKGRYPCDVAPEKASQCDPSLQLRNVFQLSTQKRYRLRIINVSGWTTFNVTMDGFMFEVIEVDGVDVGRIFLTEALSFGPGQRYSLILYRLPNVSGSKFLLRAEARAEFMFTLPGNINKYPQAFQKHAELTALIDFSLPSNQPLISSLQPWDYKMRIDRRKNLNPTFLEDLSLSPYRRDHAPEPDQHITVTMTFWNDPETGIRHASFNNQPYIATSGKPLLAKMLRGERLPEHARAIFLPHKSVVQLVVNNPMNGTHQLHLHGHHFWVIGKGHVGEGNFDENRHSKYELDACQRDTVAIKERSYTVIRFKADNPGLWTFHCHIDWHNLSGMALNFVEGADIARRTINITSEARRVCADHGVVI